MSGSPRVPPRVLLDMAPLAALSPRRTRPGVRSSGEAVERPTDELPPTQAPEQEPDIPAPAGTGEQLSDEDRVLLVFSYLGPLSLIAYLAGRREYVRWHARQGVIFFLAAFGVILVTSTIEAIAGSIHWFLGRTTGLFSPLISL